MNDNDGTESVQLVMARRSPSSPPPSLSPMSSRQESTNVDPKMRSVFDLGHATTYDDDDDGGTPPTELIQTGVWSDYKPKGKTPPPPPPCVIQCGYDSHGERLVVRGYADGVLACAQANIRISDVKTRIQAIGVRNHIVYASMDSAMVVDTASGEIMERMTLSEDTRAVAVAADASLLTVGDSRSIQVWDTATGKFEQMDEIKLLLKSDESFVIACNSRAVVMATRRRCVVYDVRNNNTSQELDEQGVIDVAISVECGAHELVGVLCEDDDGTRTWYLWNTVRGQRLHTYAGIQQRRSTAPLFSYGGAQRLVMSAEQAGALGVYDALTAERLHSLDISEADVWCLHERTLTIGSCATEYAEYRCNYPAEMYFDSVVSVVVSSDATLDVLLVYDDGHCLMVNLSSPNERIIELPINTATHAVFAGGSAEGNIVCATKSVLSVYDRDGGEIAKCALEFKNDNDADADVYQLNACASGEYACVVMTSKQWQIIRCNDGVVVSSGDGECMAFCSRQQNRMCVSSRQSLIIMDFNANDTVATIDTGKDAVAVSVSNNEDRIAVIFSDGTLCVYDSSSTIVFSHSNLSAQAPVSFSNDDGLIICGPNTLIDARSGRIIRASSGGAEYTLQSRPMLGDTVLMMQSITDPNAYILQHTRAGYPIRLRVHATNRYRQYLDTATVTASHDALVSLIQSHGAGMMSYSLLFHAARIGDVHMANALVVKSGLDPLWTPPTPFKVCNQRCTALAVAIAFRHAHVVLCFLTQIENERRMPHELSALFQPYHFGRIITRSRIIAGEDLVIKQKTRHKGQQTTWRMLARDYPQRLLQLLAANSFYDLADTSAFHGYGDRDSSNLVSASVFANNTHIIRGSDDLVDYDPQNRSIWMNELEAGRESDVTVRAVHRVSGISLCGWDTRTMTQAQYMRHHPIVALLREGVLEAFDMDIVRLSIDYKWRAFARTRFLRRLYAFVTFLTCFTVATIEFGDHSYGEWSTASMTRIVLELIVLAFGVFYGIQEWQQFRKYNASTYFSDFWNYLDISQVALVLTLLPLHIMDSDHRRPVQSITAILLWMKLLHFARAFFSTGPFIKMIVEITKGIGAFLLILVIVLCAFGHAWALLFIGNELQDEYASWTILLKVYRALLGDFDVEEIRSANYSGVSIFLFVLFTLLVAVLMLNLLIALMSSIYEDVQNHVEAEWYMERAELITELERSLRSTDDNPAMRSRLFPQYIHSLKRISDSHDDTTSNSQLRQQLQRVQSDFVKFKAEMHQEFELVEQRALKQLTILRSIAGRV